MPDVTHENIADIFGSKVFNSGVMRKRLPKHIYASLLKTMKEDLPLEENVAEVVANAMKDWALELGATHFTHWFQPMTGITAEKHDAFINPTEDGKVIMEFSGKELVKGEPDASSFPSGGLRATFEARGYTAWDPTSYAFIKGSTLCIPTVFCSYSGEILDKKTPLLRSMEVLDTHAVRILKLFGKDDVKKVTTTIGAEQEYFLIERDMFKERKDLILTGRTLFGAKPPKGQEMETHYFGRIRGRVAAYMADLDKELWRLGIASKTRHNEVAPSQHEMAPIFTNTNVATDNNQLVMEFMQRVAYRHDLACLLHEKPFDFVNGSGKHNNFSMSTNTGENLLTPGDDPVNNKQFLLFLCATIEAVNKYSEMLRITVASAGNDHRLGANEAPPAIVSIFLGEQLTAALKSIETGKPVTEAKDLVLEMGVSTLPKLIMDATDRNRTSPFAFTGNKFEFRMLGSNQSIAGPNITLNTIVADVLCDYADVLEKADDFDTALSALLQKSIKENKRIVFNGNNYSEEWVEEAARRGLPNLKTTPAALAEYASEKNVKLFARHNIYTPTEVHSRYEIHLDEYSKTINIEALTMLNIAKREISPAVVTYTKEVCDTLLAKKACGDFIDVSAEATLAERLSKLSGEFIRSIDDLEKILAAAQDTASAQAEATYYCDQVIPAMEELRKFADELESLVGKKYWPYPNYEDILFYV
ncbi:glutamine synthetase type III [Acetobacterium tundrae]|uniref:Glutamine synthetase type III n=5 Tax=Acetobacterium tundrae TaxID=132932 RepID=A0ABR6WL51_9FIRM|nr:glutamine synthetase III [Acetobacterium tundrae]MBC3796993.1 glutamine synthetase type III [Acetobacterium tundrae]